MHWRKAGALHHVGHIAAQVGVNDLGASNADHLAHLLFRQVSNFKNTGLLGLDQKHGFVRNFGVHRGRHRDLKHAFYQ